MSSSHHSATVRGADSSEMKFVLMQQHLRLILFACMIRSRPSPPSSFSRSVNVMNCVAAADDDRRRRRSTCLWISRGVFVAVPVFFVSSPLFAQALSQAHSLTSHNLSCLPRKKNIPTRILAKKRKNPFYSLHSCPTFDKLKNQLVLYLCSLGKRLEG